MWVRSRSPTSNFLRLIQWRAAPCERLGCSAGRSTSAAQTGVAALQRRCPISMAASSLMPSELERRRLRATKAQLDRRWTMLSALLSARLDRQGRAIVIEAEYQAAGVWTGLRGEGWERIARN